MIMPAPISNIISSYRNLFAENDQIPAMVPQRKARPVYIFFIDFVLSPHFSFKRCVMSFPTSSSILLSNAMDRSINCSGFGEVSPNSQFEIVCLVTFTFSASFSCENPFSFLHITSPPGHSILNIVFAKLPNTFGTCAKNFNIPHFFTVSVKD